MKNKDYNPIYYKSNIDLDKPIDELIQELRNDITKIRGKIFDIKQYHGFEELLESLEGGLTCMISAMYNTVKQFKK